MKKLTFAFCFILMLLYVLSSCAKKEKITSASKLITVNRVSISITPIMDTLYVKKKVQEWTNIQKAKLFNRTGKQHEISMDEKWRRFTNYEAKNGRSFGLKPSTLCFGLKEVEK